MTTVRRNREPRQVVRLGVAVASATMVLAIAGCTPEVDGITGLTRDSGGALQGVWQSCTGELAGAILIRDSNTGRSEHIGRWEVSNPEKQATWPVQSPSAPRGWDVWRPAPSGLDSGHVYTLFAWRKESVTNALPIDFKVEDLDGLTEGKVLINDPSDQSGSDRVTTVTMEEFEKAACGG